jgi:hypothetical protein
MCQLISCPQCAESWPEALAVCVDLNTQYPWDAPITRSLGGLSPGIVKATVLLKWGVQETHIPSKPWVAWLFEHPVAPSSLVGVTRRFRGAYCPHHHPDDGGSTHLWNVGLLLRDYTALYLRRLLSSYSPPWRPEISRDNLCILLKYN